MKNFLSTLILIILLLVIFFSCQKQTPDSLAVQNSSSHAGQTCVLYYFPDNLEANPLTAGNSPTPSAVWNGPNGYYFLVHPISGVSINNTTGEISWTWTSALTVGCYNIGVNAYAQDNQNGTPICSTTFYLTIRGIETVAGDGLQGYTGNGGLATNAKLNEPAGIVFDGSGNMYISDEGNNVIRKVAASTGDISTVAGDGTAGFSGDGGAATSPYEI